LNSGIWRTGYRWLVATPLRSILVVLTVLAAPPAALACACCAERGAWFQAVERLGTHERAELNRVRFAREARLYLTAAGFAAVRGITRPAARYTISRSVRAGRWTLAFRDARGGAGTLSFAVPPRGESFGVDPRDGRSHPGGGPLLYKEWRLSGAASATGSFSPRGGLRFRLVLQGRGNVCLAAEQFRHWRLEVTGPDVRYAFYGALQPPAPRP